MKPIRLTLVGELLEIERYNKALNFLDQDIEITTTYLTDQGEKYADEDIFSNSDAVLFLGNYNKQILINAAKAVKHIFIDDYTTVLNKNINKLRDLANEAKIKVKISFPKMYYWGIEDIIEEYKNIKHVSFFREYNYLSKKDTLDLVPEILATIKLIGQDVIRIDTKTSPVLGAEEKTINLEFKTGSTATIKGIPVGFDDFHELRISGKDYLAFIDLRKREWHSLVKNKKTKELDKGVRGFTEIGDIEYFEIQDFINSIKNNESTFISFNDICSLYNCIELN